MCVRAHVCMCGGVRARVSVSACVCVWNGAYQVFTLYFVDVKYRYHYPIDQSDGEVGWVDGGGAGGGACLDICSPTATLKSSLLPSHEECSLAQPD